MRISACTITSDISNQVNSEFAGAGRDLSGLNQQTLARGLSQGLAAPLLGQYNTDVQNQLAAANSLYGAGNTTAGALTGSFVVEKVFTIPGLGQYFVNSVLNRDRTLILGVVMVDSFLILVFNLLVDVAYAWVDPRIDISAKAA